MDTSDIYEFGRHGYSTIRQSFSDSLSRPIPCVLAATGGILGSWLIWRKWFNRNRKLPPGPLGWPIIGNMLDMTGGNIHLDYMRLQKRDNLPDIFTIDHGFGNKVVVLNSHSAIKDAFVTQGDLFAERPLNPSFEAMGIHDEIFTKSYLDPTWNEGKQFVMSALRSVGFGSTKTAEHKLLDQVELLIEKLQSSDRNNPIDINSLLVKSTANMIFGLLFNKVYSLDDPELSDRIASVKDWYTGGLSGGTYIKMFPSWLTKPFMRGIERQLYDLTENCRIFIREEIEEHLASLDPEHPRDFLDIYLANKHAVDYELLANTAFVFLPDAMETVAGVTTWVLLYVIHHPDVMRKIQNEADGVTSGNRNVTWSDRSKLPYTEATIIEAVRISSPVTATSSHSPVRDCNYRGYYFPTGVHIIGNLYAAMMDPELFPQPELFRPERFLDDEGKVLKTDRWIPFGMGRRKCLGEQITKMELFLFVANLLQHFNFVFPENEPTPSLEPKPDILLRKPQPFGVTITPRKL